jgi:hypothetical protein
MVRIPNYTHCVTRVANYSARLMPGYVHPLPPPSRDAFEQTTNLKASLAATNRLLAQETAFGSAALELIMRRSALLEQLAEHLCADRDFDVDAPTPESRPQKGAHAVRPVERVSLWRPRSSAAASGYTPRPPRNSAALAACHPRYPRARRGLPETG